MPDLKVDVHNPAYTVHVEVRDFAAYVHGPAEPGAGGLPTGVGGRAMVLLSGGIDSPVAGYMIAKRGVELECVHFFSYPYTSELAKEKVLELARLMSRYCGRMSVNIVGFTQIQEAIRDNCPEEYFTLIMRRFMMEICRAHRPQRRLPVSGHRRKPGSGGFADHGGHGCHQLCGRYAHLLPADRYGIKRRLSPSPGKLAR